jgi:hypothetical protein
MEHVQKGRWHLPEDTEMWVGLIEQHACIYRMHPARTAEFSTDAW